MTGTVRVNLNFVPFSRHKKSICLVDLTGQNRLLPGLVQRRRRTIDSEDEDADSVAWKVGFSETSGMRNKYVKMLFL